MKIKYSRRFSEVDFKFSENNWLIIIFNMTRVQTLEFSTEPVNDGLYTKSIDTIKRFFGDECCHNIISALFEKLKI